MPTSKDKQNQQKKKAHNNTCTQSDMGEVLSNFFFIQTCEVSQ